MATGTIQKNLVADVNEINSKLTAVTFSGTRASGIAGGAANGIYDKASGTIRINLHWANPDSNVSTTTTLFTIPAAYRPSAAKSGGGIVRTGDNIPLPGAYNVSSAGVITQNVTAAGRGGFAYIEYRL